MLVKTTSPDNMARQFGYKDKRFSIDDAFEEETDEAIRVYGSTVESKSSINKGNPMQDFNSSKTVKCEDTTSRDSDSLIHEYVDIAQTSSYCWNHPKVRENWKTVCAAVVLLLVGIGLLAMGAYSVAKPQNGLQGAVFFIAGLICFVPGAYHVVYIWLAARGHRGYDFYHLPLFT